MERIARLALGTRAVLVRALRRPLTPARPAKGVAHAASNEVTPTDCVISSKSHTLRCERCGDSCMVLTACTAWSYQPDS